MLHYQGANGCQSLVSIRRFSLQRQCWPYHEPIQGQCHPKHMVRHNTPVHFDLLVLWTAHDSVLDCARP